MTATVIQIAAAVLAAGAIFFLSVFVAQFVHGQFNMALNSREKKQKKSRDEDREKSGILTLLFQAWAKRFAPLVPGKFREEVGRRIVMAGGLGGLTPAQLSLGGGLAAFLGLAIGLLAVVATGWSPWLVLFFTVGGAVLPFVWLRDQVKRRHAEIAADLPYHLDLLTLSVEAGLDFGAGVGKMVDKGKEGPLRDEFAHFLGELRLGKTRADALTAMSERVGMPALSSFVSSLIQADRMGSGLGRSLRQQADQLRIERFQRAEKLAGEAPVKMLIPLVLFIFPTIWIILGGPLVFEWIFRGSH